MSNEQKQPAEAFGSTAGLGLSRDEVERMACQVDGLKFDAFGEPRTRYVRVTLGDSHCIMSPSEGDTYLKDARENGDDSKYAVRDVWLSEREFDDLPEHDGF